MNDKTTGAWLVHHTGKLDQISGASSEYEHIREAGKAGILLSALSANSDSSLTMDTVRAISQAAGISTLEQKSLLSSLEGQHLVKVGQNGVDVLGVSSEKVLDHTAALFEAIGPNNTERAVLDAAERVSQSPQETKPLSTYLGDTYKLGSSEVTELIRQSEQIGFLDAEDIDATRRLYFNGNLFRQGNAAKVHAVLSSMSSEDARRVKEVEDSLVKRGCLALPEVVTMLGDALFSKLQSIALYDVSEVSNPTETVSFVTRPAAFSKFGDPLTEDAMDLAKAFVSCLTYGMTRSSIGRGRIQLLQRLLSSLINGNTVGPATAIGEDYRVLELKRVIEIQHAYGTRYYMRLLKREVGELALKILMEGDASDQSLPNFPSAAVARYTAPERTREVQRKRQVKMSDKAMASMLLAVRTGKFQ